MSANPAPQTTPEQALAWEAANRTRAALSSALAAILTLSGAALSALAFSKLPDAANAVVTPLDTLGHLVNGTPIPPGRAAAQVLYLGNHASITVAGAVVQGIGGLLIFFPAAFLYKATKARHPVLLRATLITAAIGAACYGIGTAASGIGRYIAASGLAENATNRDALDAINGADVLIGAALSQIGGFLLGFAFVMLGMNAMRVGLLTRFMGILAVITGATFVLPFDQQGVLRSFWLFALAFLLAGRWPNPLPAWETGHAEPWPSAAQLRERRDGGAPVPATPAPIPREPNPNTSKKKRKRK